MTRYQMPAWWGRVAQAAKRRDQASAMSCEPRGESFDSAGYHVLAAAFWHEVEAVDATPAALSAPHAGAPMGTVVRGKQCPTCHKWFIPNPTHMEGTACLVMHGPGSCCHYSELEAPHAGQTK